MLDSATMADLSKLIAEKVGTDDAVVAEEVVRVKQEDKKKVIERDDDSAEDSISKKLQRESENYVEQMRRDAEARARQTFKKIKLPIINGYYMTTDRWGNGYYYNADGEEVTKEEVDKAQREWYKNVAKNKMTAPVEGYSDDVFGSTPSDEHDSSMLNNMYGSDGENKDSSNSNSKPETETVKDSGEEKSGGTKEASPLGKAADASGSKGNASGTKSSAPDKPSVSTGTPSAGSDIGSAGKGSTPTGNTEQYGYTQEDLIRKFEEENEKLRKQVAEYKNNVYKEKEEKENYERKYETYYTSSNLVFDGYSKKIEKHDQVARWEDVYIAGLDAEDLGHNFELLKQYVTNDVLHTFGGFSSIKKLFVSGNYLIVNDVQYNLKVTSSGMDWEKLPRGTRSYIEKGMIAIVFNWAALKKMRSLRLLGFDTYEFVRDFVAPDINKSGRIGLSTFSKMLPSLDEIWIGDDHVDFNAPKSEESDNDVYKMKSSLSKAKREVNLLHGYQLDVCTGTQKIQDFFFGSVSNYAMNRGNKGMLHYSLGVTARAIGAVGAMGLNLGTHLIGGIVDLFKGGTSPVDEAEVF